MISYVQSILGQYVPLQGEGIASVNWEYIVCAIILITCLYVSFKAVLSIILYLIRR